jgi:hypothetical protein
MSFTRSSDPGYDVAAAVTSENLVGEIFTRRKEEMVVLFEVKEDKRFSDTHRFYIEQDCHLNSLGRFSKSGITTTKSDYWVFVTRGGRALHAYDIETVKYAVENFGAPIFENNRPPNPSRGTCVTLTQLEESARIREQDDDN